MKRLAKSGTRICRSCAAKRTNIRSNSASKAGKIGGRTTADSGKLRLYALPASNSVEAHQKRFATLKRKGRLWASKPEEQLLALLQQRFGPQDVIHHVCIDGFRIDFYINSIKTYVQMDGVYWHGLNVPYDQLKGTPKIKYDRDRKCDSHFSNKQLRLIRITDEELKMEGSNAIKHI